MKAIFSRLQEPSTWAGLAVLAGLFGNHWAPAHLDSIVQAGTAVASMAAVLLPEKS